jgi:CheY-like chemotaxis protein
MAPAPGDALATLHGLDVLLVEDTPLNQEVIGDLLANLGVNVRVADDGEAALRALEARRPDCVLMDCQMPVMDGYEATRRLRLRPEWRDLPVIALTANVMVGDKERCLAAGMNDFVGKPVDPAVLAAVLLRQLRP